MFPLTISNIVCQLFREIFKSRYFMVTSISVAKVLLERLKTTHVVYGMGQEVLF